MKTNKLSRRKHENLGNISRQPWKAKKPTELSYDWMGFDLLLIWLRLLLVQKFKIWKLKSNNLTCFSRVLGYDESNGVVCFSLRRFATEIANFRVFDAPLLPLQKSQHKTISGNRSASIWASISGVRRCVFRPQESCRPFHAIFYGPPCKWEISSNHLVLFNSIYLPNYSGKIYFSTSKLKIIK